MALRDVSNLKLRLHTSNLRKQNQPLYEVISQLIDAVGGTTSAVDDITSGSGGGGSPSTLPQTFLTTGLEQASLPNSKELIAGSNVTFTDTPTTRRIDASGGQTTILQPPPVIIPGIDGDDGDIGPPGLTGSVGAQGIQGIQGPQGVPGSQGIAGIPGPVIYIPGIDGDDGDMGPPGLAGAVGPQGPQGQTGSSTYIITGTGNPQGVTSAVIGVRYIDTNNGYWYTKRAGSGNTGWYRDVWVGANSGGIPTWWEFLPPQAVSNPTTATSIGPWGSIVSVGGTFGGSGITTPSRVVINGKTYVTLTGAATTGTITAMNMHPLDGTGTGGTSSNLFSLDDDIDMTCEFRSPATITNIRFWFGLTSNVATNADTLGAGGQGSIAFRFSTVAADGGFVGVNQATTNQTVSGTVNSFAASTSYLLRIRFVRSGTPTVFYSVNDGAETSQTANVPATGQIYAPIIALITTANVAQTLNLRRMAATFGS